MGNIDTGRVKDRRKVRFQNIDDVLSEIGRIVEADAAGKLRQLGNWTPGQIFGHVAAWIDYGYDGYPLGPAPWFVRLILRMRLKKYLRDGMPGGVRIPKVENGTFGMEPCSTAEGADRLRRALVRLRDDRSAKYDSPGFGPMSHDDRVILNLRHAELHMSYLQY